MQRLRRLSGRRAARSEERAFVIEGPVLLQEALSAGVPVEEVFVEPARHAEVTDAARGAGATVHEVRPEVLGRSLDAASPQGIAAIAPSPDLGLEAGLAAADGGLSLVLVDVADPGNAGTLLRAAEASGATAVLFTEASVDPLSPKCVRASAGALFHLPVCGEGNATQVLEGLGDLGVRRVATVVRGGTPYDEVDLTGRVAIVVGNEAHGLPGELDDLIDVRVTIPMAGRSESLNVAMAGSVLCFEALRQRRAATR